MSNNMSASAAKSVPGAPLSTGYGPASAALATIILEVSFQLSTRRRCLCKATGQSSINN
jgi:hypothetical protein